MDNFHADYVVIGKNNRTFYKCPKCDWIGRVIYLWEHFPKHLNIGGKNKTNISIEQTDKTSAGKSDDTHIENKTPLPIAAAAYQLALEDINGCFNIWCKSVLPDLLSFLRAYPNRTVFCVTGELKTFRSKKYLKYNSKLKVHSISIANNSKVFIIYVGGIFDIKNDFEKQLKKQFHHATYFMRDAPQDSLTCLEDSTST